ncbi:MAG: hypothetical protein VW862_06030 [Euryarchaeota archaeon]
MEVTEKIEPLIRMLKGAKMKLWKDHSSYGLEPGYVSENMVRWEDENKKKATGRLDVFFKNGEIKSFPEFKHGKQDYWGGFAIETLLDDLNAELNRTSGGTVGADLTLSNLSTANLSSIDSVLLKSKSREIGKHRILRRIQNSLGIPIKITDISRGSTVTKEPLVSITKEICRRLGKLPIEPRTKAECISISMELLDIELENEDTSKGGTITAYSLLKILNGVNRKINQESNIFDFNKGRTMTTLNVVCLHQKVSLNGNADFDLFQGYLGAADILKIADVPRFSDTQTNISIVNNIPPKQTPVLKWQRPLMSDKVESIGEIYSSSSVNNLMPNPIILASNPSFAQTSSDYVKTTPFEIASGAVPIAVPDLYNIEVGVGANSDKPIWILDGQHRTYGMLHTASFTPTGGIDRSNEPIPFILLHGQNYTPEMLAEIFTHVTSGATEMHPIHKAWMHYSFEIPEYDDSRRHKSLEVSTHLCAEGSFGIDANGKVTNPFYDLVRFNPKLASKKYYAFEFDAHTLGDMVYSNYYKNATSGVLSPIGVAEQLCYAIKAFETHDQYSKIGGSSSKFGSRLFCDTAPLKMLADCYVIAVLRHIVDPSNHKTYNQWLGHLSDPIRQFDNSDWRMTWIGALDGATQNDSKSIATDVFLHYLNTTVSIGQKLPDYLEGAGAKLTLTSHYWNYSTNRKKGGAQFPSSTPKNINIGMPNQNFTMGSGSQIRTGISIKVADECKNLKIKGVYDIDINPNVELKKALNKNGMDVGKKLAETTWGSLDQLNIAIKTISFSGSTETTTAVRLDKS